MPPGKAPALKAPDLEHAISSKRVPLAPWRAEGARNSIQAVELAQRQPPRPVHANAINFMSVIGSCIPSQTFLEGAVGVALDCTLVVGKSS